MNLKGQNRYRATHKESLSTNKLNQNILFTKNKKNNKYHAVTIVIVSNNRNNDKRHKGMTPLHSISLLLNTRSTKDQNHDMT